jgi:hypothetical protein
MLLWLMRSENPVGLGRHEGTSGGVAVWLVTR